MLPNDEELTDADECNAANKVKRGNIRTILMSSKILIKSNAYKVTK
jgi:hypothetical protein